MCERVCASAFVQNMQLKTQSKHVRRQMCVLARAGAHTREQTYDRQQSKQYRLFACTHTGVALYACVLFRAKALSHIECICVCVRVLSTLFNLHIHIK